MPRPRSRRGRRPTTVAEPDRRDIRRLVRPSGCAVNDRDGRLRHGPASRDGVLRGRRSPSPHAAVTDCGAAIGDGGGVRRRRGRARAARPSQAITVAAGRRRRRHARRGSRITVGQGTDTPVTTATTATHATRACRRAAVRSSSPSGRRVGRSSALPPVGSDDARRAPRRAARRRGRQREQQRDGEDRELADRDARARDR